MTSTMNLDYNLICNWSRGEATPLG